MLMMTLSMMMSLTFMFMKHPLSMGMMLLIQTTITALITGLFGSNFWYSYILFLIMIGGMLVLFIYMTSIASNEMFKYSNNLMMLMSMFMLIIIASMIMDQFFSIQMTNMTEMMNLLDFKMSLNKYLNFPSNMILFFMIIYLFITLVAVVKITNIKHGPLRQNS